MTPKLEDDIREFLRRCIREHEEEWLAIEAESLLRRMKEEPLKEMQDRVDLHRRLQQMVDDTP